MLLPSSHRPIPLVGRPDLLVSPVSSREEQYVLIQDPLTLVNVQLPILQYRILSALDGHRSLDDILVQIQQTGVSSAISAAEVFRLIIDLARKRLIWSRRQGTVDVLIFESGQEGWRRFWATIRNPFFIQCPGLYPGQSLAVATRYLGWIYSFPVAMFVAAFVAFTWNCWLLHADSFVREWTVAKLYLTGNGIWTLWVVVGLLKVMHELSHGLACERMGARCQSIGLAFLFFSPCLYCDVSDAWRLEKKWHRMAISLAGVYVELFLSALGFWCWRFSGPGLLHQISLQVFLAGSIATLLFNANPLLKFDAYYVLSDWMEIPNLYQRSRASRPTLVRSHLPGRPNGRRSTHIARAIARVFDLLRAGFDRLSNSLVDWNVAVLPPFFRIVEIVRDSIELRTGNDSSDSSAPSNMGLSNQRPSCVSQTLEFECPLYRRRADGSIDWTVAVSSREFNDSASGHRPSIGRPGLCGNSGNSPPSLCDRRGRRR